MIAARTAVGILETVASLAPVPYLDIAFSIFKSLHASIKRVRGIRAQMTAMATSIAQLLQILNEKLQGMEHLDPSILNSLEELNGLLADICETALQYSGRSHLKIFFTPKDIQALIDEHQRKIERVTSNFQMHLQMIIHNDVRKFEEARKEDHKELLRELHEIKKSKRQFVQAANEAMQDESPLTEKDVKEYSSIVDTTPAENDLERDIVDKMLRCLNRSSILVPQYPGSTSTGSNWSPQQHSPNHPPNYYYSEEPAAMAETESQLPFQARLPYPPYRAAYPPAGPAEYSQYSAPAGQPPSWVPRSYTNANGSQPYGPVGQATMEMPIPHHYHTMG